MGWKLVHEDKGKYGSSKVYQNEKGDVRIDSYNGNVRDKDNHDRVTLKTSNGGQLSGHGYNHENKFDTQTGKGCEPNTKKR